MTICEHCYEEIQPLTRTESTGGHYGDTYATQEWNEMKCPECGANPIETIQVEGEIDRRYHRRYKL